MIENFPELMKKISVQIQDVQWIQSRINKKKSIQANYSETTTNQTQRENLKRWQNKKMTFKWMITWKLWKPLWNKPLVWKKSCQRKVMYLVQYDPWIGMK